MKETLGKILRIFTTVLMVLSICMMIFTVISVLTFNRSDRQLFGYRAFIVLSDSMSATDVKAGDLVLTRDVDPATLQPGDIIAFPSTNDENYGQTVTAQGIALRFRMLKQFEIDEIEKAAMSLLAQRKFTTMPTVADFLEHLGGGSAEDKAEATAGKALRAVAEARR